MNSDQSTIDIRRCFDLIVAKTSIPKDSVYTGDPMIIGFTQENLGVVDNTFLVGSKFHYVIYFMEGKASFLKSGTDEKWTFVKGESTIQRPFSQGEWVADFEEDTIVLCVSPYNNPTKIPIENHLTKFYLAQGDSVELPIDTKLFVGHGTIGIGERNFEYPSQVRVKTEPKIATGITDVYGFIVK